MRIAWAQNPLLTIIELDEGEKVAFRAKVLKEYLDDDASEEWCRDIAEHYIYGALPGGHIGDCTCVPCTCSKCCAEELLGIDTLRGLGKHEGHTIDVAFKRSGGGIEAALEYLRTHDPDDDSDNPNSWKARDPKGWAACLPGWRKTQTRAYEWLRAYRDERFRAAGSALCADEPDDGNGE